MSETLMDHFNAFGEAGRYTFLTGLSVADARAIGPVDLAWSYLTTIKRGMRARIRGTDQPLTVLKVLGTTVVLGSYGDGSAEAFLEVRPRWGSWAGGMISIHKAHLLLEHEGPQPGLVIHG